MMVEAAARHFEILLLPFDISFRHFKIWIFIGFWLDM